MVQHEISQEGQTTVQPTRAHFGSLESLRGIAALLVVFYHISWQNPLYEVGLIRNGALMVDLFFVLSGFVIMHSYGDKIRNTSQLRVFMWLRLGRLYPLHFAFLLVFLAIETLKFIAERKLNLTPSTPAFSLNNITSFLYNAALIQSMGLLNYETFNGPSWSISTEFYTYLLFALILTTTSKKKYLTLVFSSIAVGSFVAILMAGQTSLTFIGTFSILRCTFGFFIGTLAYQIYQRLITQVTTVRTPALEHIGSYILPLMLLWPLAFKYDDWHEFLVPPFVATIVIFLSLFPYSPLSRALSIRPAQWLGKVSYSIYMTHMAVVWVFSQIVRLVLGTPALKLGNEIVFDTSPFLGISLSVVFTAVVLIVSFYTHKFIEEPFRLASKRIAAGPLFLGASAQKQQP